MTTVALLHLRGVKWDSVATHFGAPLLPFFPVARDLHRADAQ